MKWSEDGVRFTAAISEMFLGGGRGVPTDPEKRAYWRVLRDLDIAQVETGFIEARKTNGTGFLPTDGRVRACALKEDREPPYHARLQLPAFEPKEPWPEPSPKMAARLERLTEGLAKSKGAP